VNSDSRNANVRRLTRELAREQESHVHELKRTLAALPAPYRPGEGRPEMPLIGDER